MRARSPGPRADCHQSTSFPRNNSLSWCVARSKPLVARLSVQPTVVICISTKTAPKSISVAVRMHHWILASFCRTAAHIHLPCYTDSSRLPDHCSKPLPDFLKGSFCRYLFDLPSRPNGVMRPPYSDCTIDQSSGFHSGLRSVDPLCSTPF